MASIGININDVSYNCKLIRCSDISLINRDRDYKPLISSVNFDLVGIYDFDVDDDVEFFYDGVSIWLGYLKKISYDYSKTTTKIRAEHILGRLKYFLLEKTLLPIRLAAGTPEQYGEWESGKNYISVPWLLECFFTKAMSALTININYDAVIDVGDNYAFRRFCVDENMMYCFGIDYASSTPDSEDYSDYYDFVCWIFQQFRLCLMYYDSTIYIDHNESLSNINIAEYEKYKYSREEYDKIFFRINTEVSYHSDITKYYSANQDALDSTETAHQYATGTSGATKDIPMPDNFVLYEVADFETSDILNFSFEDWTVGVPDNWTVSAASPASVTEETTIVHDGSSSIKMKRTSASSFAKISQILAYSAGTRWFLWSFWVYPDPTNTANATLRDSGTFAVIQSIPIATGTEWEQYHVFFSTSVTSIEVLFVTQVTLVNQEIYIDNVILKEVDFNYVTSKGTSWIDDFTYGTDNTQYFHEYAQIKATSNPTIGTLTGDYKNALNVKKNKSVILQEEQI